MNPLLRSSVTKSKGRWTKPSQQRGPLGTATVVIPCYKYGHYLPGAISAALDQPDLEVSVIIVDDCSPDGSGDIADGLAEGNPRVSVIHHAKNRGHIATYNAGLDEAKGDFVALVSADDLLVPGALSRSAALMSAQPTVGFVYGRAVHFTGAPPRTRARATSWITWSGSDWIAARCRAAHNVIASPEVLMRTSVMRTIGGYRPDLPHSGDLEMWMRAATTSDVGYIVGADQALYRQHPINMHKEVFLSGQAQGKLIDLQHRWAAFETVINGSASEMPGVQEFESHARKALADEALKAAGQAFLRKDTEFPVADFESFARSIDPLRSNSSEWRALRRRQAARPSRLPVNPRWLPKASFDRLSGSARVWRINNVGM